MCKAPWNGKGSKSAKDMHPLMHTKLCSSAMLQLPLVYDTKTAQQPKDKPEAA
jgi:hypothetical protein